MEIGTLRFGVIVGVEVKMLGFVGATVGAESGGEKVRRGVGVIIV
jgi:hypothetical protein